MPASVTPMASTTAMQPFGMASIAVRVEIGDDQDSGVARSSRAGTKRSVKAGPTSRGCPGRSGRGAAHPDVSQALLEQNRGDGGGGYAGQGRDRFGGQGHRKAGSGRDGLSAAHLAGRGHRVKGVVAGRQPARSQHFIAGMQINLLNLQAHLRAKRIPLRRKTRYRLISAQEPQTVMRPWPRPLSPPRLLPSGDSAITVEFSRNIDDAANRRVLALDRALAQ